MLDTDELASASPVYWACEPLANNPFGHAVADTGLPQVEGSQAVGDNRTVGDLSRSSLDLFACRIQDQMEPQNNLIFAD